MSYMVRSIVSNEVVSTWSDVGLALREVKDLNQGRPDDDQEFFLDYEDWGGAPIQSAMEAQVTVSKDELDYLGGEEVRRHYMQKLSRFMLSRVAEYLPVSFALLFSVEGTQDGGATVKCEVANMEMCASSETEGEGEA